MSMHSENSGSNSRFSKFLYGAIFYALLGSISLATTFFTEAEIKPTYLLFGFLGGAAFIIVRDTLTDYSLLRSAYTVTVGISLVALATQNVTGKLSMVTGACFSTIVVSYYLEIHRE